MMGMHVAWQSSLIVMSSFCMEYTLAARMTDSKHNTMETEEHVCVMLL